MYWTLKKFKEENDKILSIFYLQLCVKEHESSCWHRELKNLRIDPTMKTVNAKQGIIKKHSYTCMYTSTTFVMIMKHSLALLKRFSSKHKQEHDAQIVHVKLMSKFIARWFTSYILHDDGAVLKESDEEVERFGRWKIAQSRLQTLVFEIKASFCL